ncbi:unnamed protein product, partial [Symbiodinium pilosum]
AEVIPLPEHIAGDCKAAAAVKIAGTELLIRMDQKEPGDAESARCLSLLASSDSGETWEALESILRRRRLHKVVRAAPIATRTVEFAPDEALQAQAQVAASAKHQPKSLSLAELANLPLEQPSCRLSGLHRPPKVGFDRPVPQLQASSETGMYHHKASPLASSSSHR